MARLSVSIGAAKRRKKCALPHALEKMHDFDRGTRGGETTYYLWRTKANDFWLWHVGKVDSLKNRGRGERERERGGRCTEQCRLT